MGVEPHTSSSRVDGDGLSSSGVGGAWADFYANRAAGRLGDLSSQKLQREAIESVLSGLAADLSHVRRCSAPASAPGKGLTLEAMVRSKLFARSAIVHLHELPDGRVLCATRQGDLGRYDLDKGMVDWVGTGLGQVSCMSVLPDGRLLVGTVCGRGFTLQMGDEAYEHTFFTWSGRDLGPMYGIEGFPGGRVVALAREGAYEWVSSGRPVGARRLGAFPASSAMAFASPSELYLLQWDGTVLYGRISAFGRDDVVARVAQHPHATRMARDERGNIITLGPLGAFKVWEPQESRGEPLRLVLQGALNQLPLQVQPLSGGGFFAFVDDVGHVIKEAEDGQWRADAVMRISWPSLAPYLMSAAGTPGLQLRNGKFLAVATTVDHEQYSVLCLFDTGGVARGGT